jgi:cytochrome oxidase Cu insertion factor (SCO1/SenC/PrrC family)
VARSIRALASALLALLAACGGSSSGGARITAPAADDPVAFRTVGDFALVDQDGARRNLADWSGAPFAVAMIFTSCAGPCPAITDAMAKLQRELPATSSIRLVSVSVDPRTDTPPVLKSYAIAHGADPARWTFLTGDEPALHALIRDSLMVSVDGRRADQPGAFQPTHDSRIIAIDKRGRVRGYYEVADEVGWRALRDRLLFLEREQP